MSIESNNSNKINAEVVKYAADLSRLSLDDETVAKMEKHLSQIIGYIEQLNEVDTDGVVPTSHVLSTMKNVFREDVLKTSLDREDALENAPEKNKGFFKVPRVI